MSDFLFALVDPDGWHQNESAFTPNSEELRLNQSILFHPTINYSVGTISGSNNSAIQVKPFRHLSFLGQVLITLFYVFGATANIFSLVLLARGESSRNKKLALMVRCLAGNDLLALTSSFLLMYMQLYLKADLVSSRWFCGLRVLTRLFGFSSGSVASVMAVERYIALTRPFVHQKHITYKVVKRAIFTLWFLVVALVFLPLLGFGLYYDPKSEDSRHICARYRYATSPADVAYAYLVFAFGTLMCVVIVTCNMAVVRVLYRVGPESVARRTTVSRDSRELAFNHTTPDELSFAKLMVVLCIFFVACWLPQMATIIIAQANPSLKNHPFFRVADVFTALNFILDPIVYVLSRRPHRRGLRRLLKPLCHLCWSQPETSSLGRSNSQESSGHYKASCVQGLRIRSMTRVHYGQMAHKESDDDGETGPLNSSSGSRRNWHLTLPCDLIPRTPNPMIFRDAAEDDVSQTATADLAKGNKSHSRGSPNQTLTDPEVFVTNTSSTVKTAHHTYL